MEQTYLDNRIKLVKKIDRNYKPTIEELQSAYGYLDYCNSCGKELKFAEPYTHSMFGNYHKFGCSIFARTCGYLYQLIKLITFPIWIPILLVLVFIEWIKEKFWY